MDRHTPRRRPDGGAGNHAWDRTFPVSRIALPLLTVAVLASACSNSAASEADSFRARAASHCTEVINDHLLTQADESGLDVLMATMEDQEPTAEELAEWAASVSADLERRESVRAALTELSSEDEAEQRSWEQIIEAGDADIEFVRGRAELLGTQDWAQITAGFTPGGLPGALPEEALAALDLENSDCQWVHNAAILAGSAEFVRAATTACTEIGNRRFAAGYVADMFVSHGLQAETFQTGSLEELSEEEAQALTRLHEEWVQTVADLEAVDGEGAVDPQAWTDAVAAAQEREDVFAERAAAAEAEDLDALADALSVRDWEYFGADFASVGLEYRSCSGVQF